MRHVRRLVVASLAFLLVLAGRVPAAGETSCISCHGNPALFGGEKREMLEQHRRSVHADVDLSCHDCHGGNPDPALSGDLGAAMNPNWEENPYRGVPEPMEVPGFCGRCHSDPSYMRRFQPNAAVDQEDKYWTSKHGAGLRAGDTKVATCTECHGAHDVLRVSNSKSPVHPTNVATTCARCHGDAERMAGYTLPDGQPLPTDQYVQWRRSVHAAALLEREDFSAPTCNDCHGDHGATPPGVTSIAYVCGQCHGREAELFRRSKKAEGFTKHDALLSAGTCVDCHGPPEPPEYVRQMHDFAECATCHENHGIVRPSVAMLYPLPETPCAFCHEQPEVSSDVPDPDRVRRHYREVQQRLLDLAGDRKGEALFNWLVEQARHLEWHTRPAAEGDERVLRPHFEKLFRKFRIGQTTYSYEDTDGRIVERRVVRCDDCHRSDRDEGSIGLRTSAAILAGMSELTALTARAERVVLAAERGGVEVREAPLHIDEAVAAQIQLEVLVHSFHTGEGSEFAEQLDGGLEHAREALELGRAGLEELAYRRSGLAVSLGVIALVLLALGLKIRQLSREESGAARDD